jgi:hypothetical protein
MQALTLANRPQRRLEGARHARHAPASAACKGHEHEARGVGVFQTTTEIAARSRWRAEVRSHDGDRWARWSLARDKTMRCRKLEPGRRWRCVARAIPCDS